MDAEVSKRAASVMRKVRGHLEMHKPFYGSLLFRLHVREAKPSEGVQTMAVDGKTLAYCAAFVLSRTFDDLIFIVCHEITHCVLGHPERSRKPRNAEVWQQAADHAVNLSMKGDPSMRVPYDALCDSQYEGLLAEQIYDCMMKEQAKQQEQQEQQEQQSKQDEQAGAAESSEGGAKEGGEDEDQDEGEGDAGEGEGEKEGSDAGEGGEDAGGGGEGDQSRSEEEEGEGSGGDSSDGSGSDEAPEGSGGDSGGAGGKASPGEEEGSEEDEAVEGVAGSQHGDVVAAGSLSDGEEDEDGILSEEEAQALTEEWAEAVISASVIDQGEEAGAALRSLKGVLDPPRSFEEELDRFVTERVQGVDDWSRANRRYADVYLPSNQSMGARAMVYIIDTSGSISDGSIRRMESAVQDVSERLRVRDSFIIYADAEVMGIEEYHDEPPRFEAPKGGGGTRFDPALQAVLEMQRMGQEIAGVVYLTDQFGSLDRPQDYRDLELLWVNVDPRWVKPMPVGAVCSM